MPVSSDVQMSSDLHSALQCKKSFNKAIFLLIWFFPLRAVELGSVTLHTHQGMEHTIISLTKIDLHQLGY